MSIRYLNLLFAAVVVIAGLGLNEVSRSVNSFKAEQVSVFGISLDKVNENVKAINRTKRWIAGDIKDTGITFQWLGSLYGLVFLLWEVRLFIRRKRSQKHELQSSDRAPDEGDDN